MKKALITGISGFAGSHLADFLLAGEDVAVSGIVVYRNAYQGAAASHVIWSEKPPKDLERKTRLPRNHETKKGMEEAEKNIGNISDIR
ncbi:MAG: hypothetical protein CEO22_534, partial [Candidatus Berkelbacteria bacterium Gr01-1014_85]